MTNGMPEITSEEEAREIMTAGIAEAELKFIKKITAPFSWIRHEGPDQKMRNGSAFFLNAGEGPFAVTAQHVIAGWQKDFSEGKSALPQIGCLPIDFTKQDRIIDDHEVLDIATFRISPEEIDEIGKTVLTGQQSVWPPPPPQQDRGIYMGGFAAIETRSISSDEYFFGFVGGHGAASSVNEKDVSSLIEHEKLFPILGNGVPKLGYNFGGLSGGPMLTVVEHGGLRSWRLAGVIYKGPNPSTDPAEAIEGIEIIKARRAHFISPDGTLDIERWNNLSL